jgi:hypothetical protein
MTGRGRYAAYCGAIERTRGDRIGCTSTETAEGDSRCHLLGERTFQSLARHRRP